MKVLVVHNAYQQPGGEDRVVADEIRMLEQGGHTVLPYRVSNDDVVQLTRPRLAARTVWSQDSYDALARIIDERRPDVMHVHNTLPLISPSAYYAATRRGVAVVQTLHNFRLLCPNALFFRDGATCEECLGKSVPWPAVRHGCYRKDRPATAAIVTMLTAHRAARTYSAKVDAYIAPSVFVQQKFVSNGFAPERMFVKPHVVHPDRGAGAGNGGYALYVGRLSAEKGIRTILEAWQSLSDDIALLIVGDGPLAPAVAEAATRGNVVWLGQRSEEDVHALLQRARFLVLPSECYESFGRVAAESFAAGTPVIASNGGSLRELVDHDRTGFLFQQGSAEDLTRQVRRALRAPRMVEGMRAAARAQYERCYSASVNLQQLLDVYRQAISWRADATPSHVRLPRLTMAGDVVPSGVSSDLRA